MSSSEESDPYSVLCPDCGLEFNNGPSNQIILTAGNYCPDCGRRFTEDDHLTKEESYARMDADIAEDADDGAGDGRDSTAEKWAFDCNRCGKSEDDITEAGAYAMAGDHEDHTGHFDFGIYYEGELVDGS